MHFAAKLADDAHGVFVWVAGSVIGAAIIGTFLFLKRPVFWVCRKLVAEPFTAWFRREVGELIDERVAPIMAKVEKIDGDLQPSNGDQRSISDRLDTVKQRTASLEFSHNELKEQLVKIVGGNQ